MWRRMLSLGPVLALLRPGSGLPDIAKSLKSKSLLHGKIHPDATGQAPAKAEFASKIMPGSDSYGALIYRSLINYTIFLPKILINTAFFECS